jgi:23S rRNA (uracil1939-C5)-methyltransferase
MTVRAKIAEEQLADLTVERIGAGGDGIGRWHGEPVFLPFTAPGDRVRAGLQARRGGGREGRVVEWLDRGPGRITPACPHFGRCGGCALQHLEPDLYAEAKLAGLHQALAHIGVSPDVVQSLHHVGTAGRRRIRVGIRRPSGPVAPARVGLRERFSHELVDLRHCVVIAPALLALIDALRRRGHALLSPGGNADASMTATDAGIDLLIESAEPPALPTLEALAGLADEQGLARIVWRTGAADVPVVEARTPHVMHSGVTVTVPPGGFLQASAEAERLIVAEVAGAIDRDHAALDLYAGLGAFAFALARDGRRVHAVEGDAAAVAALSRAAAGHPGVTVERRDLAREPLSPAELACWRAAVFDPPRAGARRQAEALAASNLHTVVAVSCNPATFARDARCLIGGGFRLERVVPIDQFVWSAHLEVVGVFRR